MSAVYEELYPQMLIVGVPLTYDYVYSVIDKLGMNIFPDNIMDFINEDI